MRALAFASASIAALAAWSALADGGEGVRLDYQVDPSCAAQDAFVAEVHARSPRIRFAPDAPRTLVVRVEPKGGKLAGRIELGGTQRTVAGATCEEVISALGLVTALALDPLASTAPNPSSTASAAPSASTTATASASASTMDSGADATSEDERELPVEKRKWSFAAGADGEVVLGAGPDPMFAVPVFFEVARALGEHFALGGALRFVHADDTALTGGIGGDFDWTVGALDLCAIVRAGRFRADACERNTIGILEGHGLGVVPANSVTRPWVDLGLALALRVRIIGPFFLEATGHVGAVLIRDRFFLEPNQTVFQAPLFMGEVGGGIGFEIW